MSKRLIIGGIVIAVCAVAAVTVFNDSLTTYVDFEQARTINRNCQVMGEIAREDVSYDPSRGVLQFPIIDDRGDRMVISYAGTVPGNFEQAKSVVAIGKYHQGQFEAERLLVKCPSKYQGLEEQGEENPHEATPVTGGV